MNGQVLMDLVKRIGGEVEPVDDGFIARIPTEPPRTATFFFDIVTANNPLKVRARLASLGKQLA